MAVQKNSVVVNFDISTPIDIAKATKTLGGKSEIFYKMLQNFEHMTIQTIMKEMVKYYARKEYK